MDYGSLESCAKIVFVDNYGKLYSFFKKAWASKHVYKVAMARRGFNLNYAFKKIDLPFSSDEENDWISDTALLLNYKGIAEHYQNYNCFPKILILDDIAFSGKTIAKLLDELEQLILFHLGTTQEVNENVKLSVHWALVSAVEIRVFACGNRYLLLEKAFRDNVKAEFQLSPKELKELSQQISRFLWGNAICNTSYTVSSDAQVFQPDSLEAGGTLWNYRGHRTLVRFPEYGELWRGNSVIPTFRMDIHKNSDGKIAQKPVSGLVLFGDIESRDLDQLCDEIVSQINKNGETSKIAEILKNQHPLLQRPRTQMLSCIFSILNFALFWYQNGSKPIADPSNLFFKYGDAAKIMTNFGFALEMKEEFDNLIQWAFSADESTLREMYQALCDAANSLDSDFCNVSIPPIERVKEVNEAAEDIFYRKGMEVEKEICDIREKNGIYQPEKSKGNEITVKKYLEQMQNSALEIDGSSSLACMLSLADSGMVALDAQLSEDKRPVCSVLRACELSTYVLPRRFYLFLPALARIECDRWRLGLATDKAVKQFIQAIPIEPDSESERKRLLELKEIGDDFVDQFYRCWQRFHNWDVELMDAGDDSDSEDFDIENYFKTYLHNRDRRKAYLNMAKDFIKEKDPSPY